MRFYRLYPTVFTVSRPMPDEGNILQVRIRVLSGYHRAHTVGYSSSQALYLIIRTSYGSAINGHRDGCHVAMPTFKDTKTIVSRI